MYAKAGEYGFLRLQIQQISFPLVWANFNLTNGTVGLTSGSYGATIIPVGNGWYRCSITATATGTSNSGVQPFVLDSDRNDGNVVYLGNGFSGIYIWGAQFEAGAFATSYTPTVASQVTRAADAASMTGANFSSWFNQAEGSIYVEGLTFVDNPGKSFWSLTDGSNANYILCASASARQLFVNINATNTVDLSPGFFITPKVFSANVFSKSAGAYRVNDYAAVTTGSSVLTDTSSAVPVVNRFNIGLDNNNTNSLCGYIKKLTYYPARISNNQLQALTS
jgi:hypothetical protein